MKKTVKLLTLLLALLLMLQVAPLAAIGVSAEEEATGTEGTVQQTEGTLSITELRWRNADQSATLADVTDGMTVDCNHLLLRVKLSEAPASYEVKIDGVSVTAQQIGLYIMITVELVNGAHVLDFSATSENGSVSRRVNLNVAGPRTDYPELKAGTPATVLLGATNELVITGKNMHTVGEILVNISMTPSIKVESVDIAKGYTGTYSWYRGALKLKLDVYDISKVTGDVVATVRFKTPVNLKPGDELSWTVDSMVVTPAEGEDIGETENFNGTFTQPETPIKVSGGYTVELKDTVAVGNTSQTIVVKDSEGNPVPGVPVYGIVDGENVLLGVTDENGELVTDFFNGKGTFEIFAKDENGVSSFVENIYCYDSVGNADGTPYAVSFNGMVVGGKSFVWMSSIAATDAAALVRLSTSADMADAVVYNGKSTVRYYHTSQSANRVNTATVTDLVPGVYYYQVGDGNVWSETKAFTVKASATSMNFAMTAAPDAASLALVAGAIANSGVDYNFAIQTEDVLGDTTDHDSWNATLNAYAGLGDLDVIHAMVRDNETAGNIFNANAAYAYYSIGNVFVGVLNYTEDGDALYKMLDDMVWDARRINYAWRVLVINRAPATTDAETADAQVAEMVPAMAQYAGIDLVISGDSSLYGRTDAYLDGAPATINGTTYLFCGSANADTAFTGDFVATDADFNALYLSVSTDNHNMTVTVYDVLNDGSVEIVDTFTKMLETCADGEHLYRFGVNIQYNICDRCGHRTPMYNYVGIIRMNERLIYSESNGFGIGWRTVNGKTYYFHPDALYAVDGVKKINGFTYVFEDCVLVEGAWVVRDYGTKLMWAGAYLTNTWHTQGGKTYYFQADGTRAVGTVEITTTDENGQTVTETYVFDEDGALIGKA